MYWYDFLRIGLVPKYFISNNPLEASDSQTKVFTGLKKPIWVQRIMLYTFIDHSISVGWSDYDNLYWAGVKSMFKVFISMVLALKMLTLYSHEWPRHNFSLQYECNVKQKSDESKEKYPLGDFFVDPKPNSPYSHHKNCMAKSKED